MPLSTTRMRGAARRAGLRSSASLASKTTRNSSKMTGFGQTPGLYATRRDLSRRGRQLTFDAQMRVDKLKKEEQDRKDRQEREDRDYELRKRTEDRLASGQKFLQEETVAAREEKLRLELLKFKADKK